MVYAAILLTTRAPQIGLVLVHIADDVALVRLLPTASWCNDAIERQRTWRTQNPPPNHTNYGRVTG